MSKLIVEVCEILNREQHPEADRLDLFTVKGWQIVANRKDDGNGNLIPRYNVGDHIIYIPPDAILPLPFADQYGFTSYLAPVKDEFGTQIGGRVKAIRLRGQPSYGCMIEADPSLEVGTDVAEKYGITKWEPPPESRDGDSEKSNSLFYAYTSIENIGNFPDVLEIGEEVVFTEKVHGCLHKDSLITLANGDLIPISDIKEGMYVLTFNIHKNEHEHKRVFKTIKKNKIENQKWIKLFFDNGCELICTCDHKIFTKNRGWVEAGELNENDNFIVD